MAAKEIDTKAEREEIEDPRNNLAVERTELAHERTHLAWVRTVFTLITAGIAIDKGVSLIHDRRTQEGTALLCSTHIVVIAPAAAATIFLVAETIEYYQRRIRLAKRKKGHLTPSVLTSSSPRW